MTLFNELASGSSKLVNSSSSTVNILGALSDSIKIIDINIENIFSGNKFWAGTSVDIGATTADKTAYILGIVSAVHTFMGARSIQAISSAAISLQIDLYEDVATVTNSGNMTSYCMNRNLTSVGTFTFNNAPATITAAGTLMPSTNILKSSINFASSVASDYRYIMKNNTKYALKITNNGVATATLTFFWTWTEN
ncbi:MAG: hypothetical protein WAZ36_05520 [Sediminibacterium sp.]